MTTNIIIFIVSWILGIITYQVILLLTDNKGIVNKVVKTTSPFIMVFLMSFIVILAGKNNLPLISYLGITLSAIGMLSIYVGV